MLSAFQLSNLFVLLSDDSDLHLQIDKTSFLSAKPFNDGLFGYIWSGARVTHGVKANNKVCKLKKKILRTKMCI